jgi:hypothetical protein
MTVASEEACMERGLLASLSPNEETTLRRVALGISTAKDLPARDVAYLVRLSLVEDKDGSLTLTDLGRRRYRALPKGASMADVTDVNDFAAILQRQIREGRSAR